MKPTITFLLTLSLFVLTFATTFAFGGNTWFLSQTEAGVGGDGESGYPQTDGDGRYIVFQSRAENLVPNSNSDYDIFLKDRVTNEVTLVSRGMDNQPANGYSSSPYISEDGRYIAFSSYASNLVTAPLSATLNVFVYERETGEIELVSTNSEGEPGNEQSIAYGISNDGRYVLLTTDSGNFSDVDTNETSDIYIKDRQTGVMKLVSMGMGGAGANDGSYMPNMSTNGRYIVFTSLATNLIGDDSNGTWDIYWHDRESDLTKIASRATDNSQNQGYVAYSSVTDDGRYVGFVAEGNSIHPNALPGNNDNLILHDMQTGMNRLVSEDGDGNAVAAGGTGMDFTANGEKVVFFAYDCTLVPTDTNGQEDVYLKDLGTGATEIVSLGDGGIAGDEMSRYPAVNRDGTVIVYSSLATNFATNDSDMVEDVFAAVAFVEPSAVTLDALTVHDASGMGSWLAIFALLGVAGVIGAMLRRR